MAESIMGVNIHNYTSTQMWNLMSRAGVKYVRVDFFSASIMPSNGVWNWTTIDKILSLCEQYNIDMLAIISMHASPSWANGGHGNWTNWPLLTEYYEDFCQAVVARYGTRIKYYELGNEPDGNSFWLPASNAAAYTDRIKVGYPAIKAGNPNAVVMVGALACGWSIPLATFLPSMYTAGAKGYFDALSLHPYTRPNPPSFAYLNTAKAIMALNGDGDLPIYVTEVGWYTGTAANAVSETVQAQYLTQLYKLVLTGGYTYVPFICWYDFKNDNTLNGYKDWAITESEGNFGLVHSEKYTTPYLPKPAYYAFKSFNGVAEARMYSKCISFNGVSGQIKLGTSNPFTGSFYFSARMKWLGGNGDYQHIFAKRDTYGRSTMMFDLALLNTNSKLILDTGASYRSFNIELNLNEVIRFLWIHDLTSSKERIYINAVLVAEASIATLGSKIDALISIGSVQEPPVEVFNGDIDEIAIGTVVPSWAQIVGIQERYEYPSLWSHLKCNQRSDFLPDESGNKNFGIYENKQIARPRFHFSKKHSCMKRRINHDTSFIIGK